ncbi:hypothetical protein AZA_07448 [Nitrospirillum viridazoti Y2]|nr:hypothetical protein AZA_07448 [Nitrospirillum amazonense Y2]
MGGGVADVGGRGVASVGFQQGCQPPLDLGERFFIRRLDKATVTLDQRCAQPVGVLVQVLERHAFGADVAVAENIGVMPPDTGDGAVHQRDLQAAARLAQGADTVGDGFSTGHGRASQIIVAQLSMVTVSLSSMDASGR